MGDRLHCGSSHVFIADPIGQYNIRKSKFSPKGGTHNKKYTIRKKPCTLEKNCDNTMMVTISPASTPPSNGGVHRHLYKHLQSNLSYPGALGLGGARNSDLSISHNTI